ncbi:MAG: lipid-A-disaccharide synthase [Gammaproteobacteria bacterium]
MKIGIAAGEISGDNLGVGLIEAIKSRCPDAEFIGVGGPAMVEAGCKSLFPIDKLSVMGLIEVLRHYRELHGIRSQLIQYFIENPPDVFIGIDYPGFNIGLETKLKEKGIKTVHYVCPQVWAWREGRLPKIAKAVDLILAILPFEEDYLKKYQIPARYIGHNLADEIPDQVDQNSMREKWAIPRNKKVIALMPGSRLKEWQYHMDVFVDTAKWCLEKRSDLHFIAVMVNQKAEDLFRSQIQNSAPDLPVTFIINNSFDSIAASDAVLCVSGTAALEIMLLKRPMVVAYRMAFLSYHVFKRLLKTAYISLPNLLSKEQLVPEYIQDQVTVENLGSDLMKFLEQPEKLVVLQEKFQQIHDQLRCNANEQAANAVLTLCER